MLFELTLRQNEDVGVKRKQKRVYQKKAAGYVADLILDSLERFPKEERQARLARIHAELSKRSKREAH